jgi:hypothetical protein
MRWQNINSNLCVSYYVYQGLISGITITLIRKKLLPRDTSHSRDRRMRTVAPTRCYEDSSLVHLGPSAEADSHSAGEGIPRLV